jgi:hypothetical protein
LDTRGRFPFGRPNEERPIRPARRRPEALVVGVYPSAFHIAWSPPPEHDPRPVTQRRRPYVSSLAVDVEPTVFWDGTDPMPDAELARWRDAVRFDDERHGRASVGTNGPSGAGLIEQILDPLGLAVDEVTFTDAVPWFFVKSGAGSQGDAIGSRFNPIAHEIGVPEGTLPSRPTVRRLVELASSSPRRESLRAELIGADVDTVITLGQEACDAIGRVADDTRSTARRLIPDDSYGRAVNLAIGGERLRWLALAHPGFIRQTSDVRWRRSLERWKASARAR